MDSAIIAGDDRMQRGFDLMDFDENIFTIGDSTEITSEGAGGKWGARVRTWIFDPPYNIGFDYGGTFTDRKSEWEFQNWIVKSAVNMKLHSEEDANMFLIIYPGIAARLLNKIEGTGWRLKQWITWVYPSNIGMSKRKCTTASRAVVWFVKGDPDSYMEAIRQPYRNPNDKRIKERISNGSTGVNLYDWWDINLRKNTSKGFKGYANQLPRELVRRCILLTTVPGQRVGDLTAGAGTTYEVAKPLERDVWLNDLNPECLSIWREI
jgi:DNA modification methylase